MTFSQRELARAVREVGSTGEPFTSAAVRSRLGMTTQDRRALARFNQEFREYCKDSRNQLTQVGKNRYRLGESESARATGPISFAPQVALSDEPRPVLPRRIQIRITRPLPAPEPEPELAFTIGAFFDWITRPLRLIVRMITRAFG